MSHHGHDHGMMTTPTPSGHEGHIGHGPETTPGAMPDHDHGSMDHGSMDHGSMDHSSMGHGSEGMDMDHMKMWFHSDVKSVILFDEWRTNSVGGIIGSMVGIFLMAMFYEGLKYYREYLFRKSYATTNFSCISSPGDGPKALTSPPVALRKRMLSSAHLMQTFLHVVQVTLSYFLMLVFMTYNIWLCIAVVLGAATGFFIFGWKKAIVVDITEHCH